MSLANATILSVIAPPSPGPGGDVVYSIDSLIVNAPCTLDEPNFAARRLIDDLELQSTAVLYVELTDWPAAPANLLVDALVTVQQAGQPSQVLRIDWAKPRMFDGVSHVQCFVRAR